MSKALNTFNRKIEDLRRAKDGVKKRWIIALTTISMTIIVGLWILYLNFALPQISKENKTASLSNSKPETKNSAVEVFNKGFKIISEDFQTKFDEIKKQMNSQTAYLKDRIEKTNEFSIVTSLVDYSIEDSETIASTPLP